MENTALDGVVGPYYLHHDTAEVTEPPSVNKIAGLERDQWV